MINGFRWVNAQVNGAALSVCYVVCCVCVVHTRVSHAMSCRAHIARTETSYMVYGCVRYFGFYMFERNATAPGAISEIYAQSAAAVICAVTQ